MSLYFIQTGKVATVQTVQGVFESRIKQLANIKLISAPQHTLVAGLACSNLIWTDNGVANLPTFPPRFQNF
jgi:hypothetical protein